MSLESLGINLRIKLVLATSWIIENVAKLLGYPNNSQGMPIGTNPNTVYGLPLHKPQVPPAPDPNNIFEAVFGNVPKSSAIEKFYYATDKEGYYNFFMERYRNVIFLPDWLSRFLQINFDICVDTSSLELIRDTLFSLSVYFMFFLQFRTMLYYFVTINPYYRPWSYIISLSDWIYDILFHLGITRRLTFFGFPLLSLMVNAGAGVIADTLNHLVFTMPYLPSEAKFRTWNLQGVPKEFIVFNQLPSLWYHEPIPDKLREFWYTERPDIYKYMRTTYAHLDMDLLPNRILQRIYDSQYPHRTVSSIIEHTDKLKTLATYSFSDFPSESQELSHHFIDQSNILLSSIVDHMGNLL